MCLIIFRWQPEQDNPLTLLSNRDEFYQRDSQAAHYWQDNPNIYGGRDLEKGGTWLAVSRQGRLACVTNYREPDPPAFSRSRGEIPVSFLQQDRSALAFAQALQEQHQDLPGFNALLCDGSSLVYTSNRHPAGPIELGPGIYGISNHLLDTPWPKVCRAKQMFKQFLKQYPSPSEERCHHMLALMQDARTAQDDQLPDTGVGLEVERLLSAIFIQSPAYGTRTTTLIEMCKEQAIQFIEQNVDQIKASSDLSKERIQ